MLKYAVSWYYVKLRVAYQYQNQQQEINIRYYIMNKTERNTNWNYTIKNDMNFQGLGSGVKSFVSKIDLNFRHIFCRLYHMLIISFWELVEKTSHVCFCYLLLRSVVF